MARIRSIKPGFWEDEKIGALPIPCRLFFIGTWNLADDEGVFRANPAILKSKIFPYDENLRISEINKWLDALVKARMLIPISYNSESYYAIRTFRNHQTFDARYPNNLIPKEIVEEVLSGDKQPDAHSMRTQCVPGVHPAREREGEYNNICANSDELTVNAPDKNDISFDTAWDLYGKKKDRKRAEARWGKLTLEEKKKALEHIPDYVKSTPDVQYRKNFLTYISGACWNDEINISNEVKTKRYDNGDYLR